MDMWELGTGIGRMPLHPQGRRELSARLSVGITGGKKAPPPSPPRFRLHPSGNLAFKGEAAAQFFHCQMGCTEHRLEILH
jgi:hypothetical protein